MSREINTWRDPYDMGFTPTRPKKIEIQPGLTVLVGCNGAGKTTLLHNIAQELKKANVPHHFYSNLNDGGTNSVSKAVFYDDLSLAAYLMTASEGEAIKENFASLITNTHSFLQTNIVEIVGVFNMILEDAKSMGKEVYIIISANEFELCRNSPCFDVHEHLRIMKITGNSF